MFRLRFRNNHVVVCGLGNLGLQLLSGYRKRKQSVVAIENHENASGIRAAQAMGAIVVVGDAFDSKILRKAGAHRCSDILAVCGPSETNLGIACLGADLAKFPGRAGRLTCWLFEPNEQARLKARERGKIPEGPGDYVINVRGLDVNEAAARAVFQRRPLDHAEGITAVSETRAHLVLIGFGSMGQALLLQAARIGHFANGKHLKVTLIARDARSAVDAFLKRYSALSRICDLSPIDHDFEFNSLMDLVSRVGAAAHLDRLTYGICMESGDSENLQVALRLELAVKDRQAQALVHVVGRRGFDTRKIHAFGMFEDVYSVDAFVHEKQDLLAKQIHENYRNSMKADGKLPEDPACKPWEELNEAFRESNRQAADHVDIKLRALGFVSDEKKRGRRRMTGLAQIITPNDLEILARMEHSRWCAERWLNGWKHGEKTVKADRIHADLVPWEKLEHPERKKDIDQVRGIEAALDGIGRGIYRIEEPG